MNRNQHDLKVHMIDSETLVTIDQLDPNDPHKNLGCHLAPTGNQHQTYKQLLEASTAWANSVLGSILTPQDIVHSYHCNLLPGIIYRLAAASLSSAQCDLIMKPIFTPLLNAYGVPRTISRTLVHASPQYAGMSLKHIYDLNGIEKLKFLMLHLRRFDYTGKLMFITLQWTQLWLGISTPFLHSQHDEYQHLTPSTWISHLWQYLCSRQLIIDTTKSYCFRDQRENDAFIMDVLTHHFQPPDLKIINRYRIALQLLRVSDMVDIRGKNVLTNIKMFVNNRKSKLLWPKQILPKKNRHLWKKACAIIQRYVSSHHLGSWLHCDQTWTWSSNHDNSLLCDGVSMYQKSYRGRKFHYQKIHSPLMNLPRVADAYVLKTVSTSSHLVYNRPQ